ncbi:hypothetical protein TrLO_g1624 [Triparma laevis f. longispina]|uniref:Wax synthase domain-containing protein n=1 Tax=Triparma laevis f. longispina TaxID=1714387 RepID=A0A9W7AE33_9STRA|nr:hypothetical protein TrLO_g1624 [Triparma laevis f. longispina]
MVSITVTFISFTEYINVFGSLVKMSVIAFALSVVFALMIYATPTQFHYGYVVFFPAFTIAVVANNEILVIPQGLPILVWASYGTIWMMRSAEVAAKTVPHQVNSLRRFICYFSNVQIVDFDSRVTYFYVKEILRDILLSGFIMSILKLLTNNDGTLVLSLSASTPSLLNLLLNNLLCAIMTQEVLTFLGSIWRLALAPTICTKPMMKHPLFLSQGIREFWGRRWNLLVHDSLKRSVHKPLKGVVSIKSSYLAVFAASAALHEYYFYLILMNNEKATYVPGKVSIFFLWNGILCALEPHVISIYKRTKLPPIPREFVTAITVLSALPLGGLFTDDWREGGIFNDVVVLAPTIHVDAGGH